VTDSRQIASTAGGGTSLGSSDGTQAAAPGLHLGDLTEERRERLGHQARVVGEAGELRAAADPHRLIGMQLMAGLAPKRRGT
jgi:hypothetical protein